MLRQLSGIARWLIYTNLYIALAAVSFQLVIVALVDGFADWNWMLSVNTFASTWLVYQFSRWVFHRQAKNVVQVNDGIYSWLHHHPKFTLISMAMSALAAIVSLFYLQLDTILLLAGLGAVSMIYPVRFHWRGRLFGLRSIPFAKIFLIAFVWAGTSVWVPLAELGYPPFGHMDRFAFHALYIFFITLPFDVVDLNIDSATRLQTIPARLGAGKTRVLIILSGLLLITYESLRMIYVGPFVIDYLSAYILLIATLAFYAVTVDNKTDKWKVMAVYDGSMIVLFLITLMLHQVP